MSSFGLKHKIEVFLTQWTSMGLFEPPSCTSFMKQITTLTANAKHHLVGFVRLQTDRACFAFFMIPFVESESYESV